MSMRDGEEKSGLVLGEANWKLKLSPFCLWVNSRSKKKIDNFDRERGDLLQYEEEKIF